MKEYFDAEMRLLRESAHAFAQAYPEQARMLNLNGGHDCDPYIERLLEGTAYLTAQIQQRIDDDFPGICETFLQQLWPHFLQPFPSVTLIEFKPRPRQLHKTYYLPTGTIIKSQALNEISKQLHCQFRTTQPLTLNPLYISNLQHVLLSNGDAVIEITFSIESTNNLDLSKLLLFLHADTTTALTLHYYLTTHVKKVFIEFPAQSPIFIGDQNVIHPANLTLSETLLPHHNQSFAGFQLLFDYFAFREKYLAVELHGLEKIHFPPNCQQFKLQLHCRTLSQQLTLTPQMIKLHCVPAINLFPDSSEPIQLTHRRSEYPVLPNLNQLDQTHIYSIDAVAGIEDLTGKRQTFNATHFSQQPSQNFYTTTQRYQHNLFSTHYLMLGGLTEFKRQTLSCAITAHNGHLPRRYLQESTINTPDKNFPSFIEFTNLCRPSSLLMPPTRANYRWQLIAHLSLNYRSVTELETLKDILALYDWSGRQENSRRITGIEKLSVTVIREIYHGSLIHGLCFNFIFQEEYYLSLADIHLFGLVLHEFLTMYATINTLIKTKITCFPSQQEFSWCGSQGSNILI